ncbi:YbaK/EbsC family protein [Sphaerisporangium sp. TRM90804]|uniref:aminoacyl-tRNA deacylase n=1 Tax=Sphaerisporangium sp. TRM90804 TaxID=3031113 RepID=UPI0024484078|nr:YbaK/EbsC family protein [Sphaerisporangium sp. TRM90804]MDH2425546.1 YbaK/EbsC family protein [Sphaerisporangium sp. TRM90804]
MKDALAIHRWLLSHQIHHEIVRLPRPSACADDLPGILRVGPASCVRVTVFEVTTRSTREPVAVVTSVAAPPRPGAVGALLGARRVRPAPAFMINAATDYTATSVSPLLLPASLTVLIDERLADSREPDDVVYSPTGERRTALRLRALDLLALTPGKLVDLQGARHRPLRGPVARDARPSRPLPRRGSPPARL